ncbi:DUF4259 domain-containing protein [Streptomyces sp. NPDC051956]|uniref:DUF4259 domain-containing protein n=1 Tax=Streptomyces sp. NPDC051956 TaxID=3365677 RepID=UPI0037D6FE9D
MVGQHPDGEPACPNYGPSEPLPEFPEELRALAINALGSVVSQVSEVAELWDQVPDRLTWRRDILRLRNVLAPPIPPQEEALFTL